MSARPAGGGALQRELFEGLAEAASIAEEDLLRFAEEELAPTAWPPAPEPGGLGSPSTESDDDDADSAESDELDDPDVPAAAAIFRHPAANREIRLGGHAIGYALTRASRRSVGLQIGAEGLSVRAPRWVAVADIESVLHAKASWIVRKLDEQQQSAAGRAAARIDWHDGVAIPYLGGVLTVRLAGAAAPVRRARSRAVAMVGPNDADAANVATSAAAAPQGSTLRLPLCTDAAPEQIGAAVRTWLREAARELFEARLAHYAPRLGVRPTRLTLSSARTRWGSASASGAIRLNWRLVHFEIETIDYVVVHELAHLREMNHGPRFWAIVASVIPDVAAARRTLRTDALPALD
ncbi:M48 family metallopeptidase [Piscinibacter koreensis]|uniref:M48 family metallopeptidase n=1 Tax=Piscinibacter koreensis TaxID=2742824 RepID=A0A7Y6NNR7_9BURK|nr:SprT family zinc-dependent metalloprotease [Schlegelella koreensis]NUZ06504.1 M48 family metallopeptidase [Schlegelella koreensis]